MSILEARDLRKRYGTVTALEHAGLVVEPGEIHGLIGPNGSGKSTLLHVIAGRTPPDGGSVVVDGRDVTRAQPSSRARKGLSIKFQLARVYPDQTVADNMLLAAQVRCGLATLALSRSRRRLAGQVDQALRDFGLLDVATAWQVSCRTGSSSGSRSRWRWPRTRACCCSTNPRAG